MAKSNLELLLFKVFKGSDTHLIKKFYADRNYTSILELVLAEEVKASNRLDDGTLTIKEYTEKVELLDLLETELKCFVDVDSGEFDAYYEDMADSLMKSKHFMNE